MDKKLLKKALSSLNLSENSIDEIHKFIDDQIKEQVNTEVKTLTAKVFGFLRNTMDSIKESALKELEEDNEIYRNSKIFEDLKSLIAIEYNNDLEVKAVSDVVKNNNDLEEEVNLLTASVETLMEENEQLKESLKMVMKQNKKLSESKSILSKKIGRLEEASNKPFKSSEKAKAISHSEKETKKEDEIPNEFITEEVIHLAK